LGGVRPSPGRLEDRGRSRRVDRGLSYRLFRRLFFGALGTSEKVDEVRIAGSIGAAFVVILTLTLPEGVMVVLVLMRIFPLKQIVALWSESIRRLRVAARR
jgi:hypothetical protein